MHGSTIVHNIGKSPTMCQFYIILHIINIFGMLNAKNAYFSEISMISVIYKCNLHVYYASNTLIQFPIRPIETALKDLRFQIYRLPFYLI